MPNGKWGIEFKLTINPISIVLPQKSSSSTGLNKQSNKKPTTEAAPTKKNKAKGGILVNKSEPISIKPVVQQVVVEEKNHFEEIHPKDDVEMLKSQVSDGETRVIDLRG